MSEAMKSRNGAGEKGGCLVGRGLSCCFCLSKAENDTCIEGSGEVNMRKVILTWYLVWFTLVGSWFAKILHHECMMQAVMMAVL